VLWGFFNLAVAYILLAHVGEFNFKSTADIGAAGLGAFLIALFAARHFGAFHGGNTIEGE
jgi:hypothetical protein